MEPLRERLVRVHNQVLQNFRYGADDGEEWRMPPPGYDGSQKIRDDCDGFCLAIRSLLRRDGIASRLVYCTVGFRNPLHHLVVEVEGWILDNRQVTVVANSALSDYRWHRISGYEPGDSWFTIE